MSQLRLPYYELSPEIMKGFRQASTALSKSSLGMALIELVYLRVSQINGCSYCLAMHTHALRKLAQDADSENSINAKLDVLAAWRVSEAFSEQERAALAWAESMTFIATTYASDDVYAPLKVHFSDTEISDLTLAISLINAFNRMAVAMRQ